MRPTFLAVAAMALFAALHGEGQPAHPRLFPPGLLPHHHPQAPPKAPAHPSEQPPAETVFDATNLGTPLVLDKDWRVGITGDPAAERPDFDDSSWAVREAKPSFADVPDAEGPDKDDQAASHGPPVRPFAWFRLHVKLAPNHGPLSLLIELPVSHNTSMDFGSQATGSDVEVYANGRHIPPQGPHGDEAAHYQAITRVYNLDLAPSDTSLTLVIRTLNIPFGLSAYTHFFATRKIRLGNPDDLNRTLELWSIHTLDERLPRLINAILLAFLSVFLFALYFTQKGHIEYLWLALHELVQVPISFIDLAGSTAYLDQLWFAAIILQLVLISAYLYFEFLIAFLALRRRWFITLLRCTAPIMAGVAPALLMVGHNHFIGIVVLVVLLGSFLWITGWLLFCFVTLIAATIRRNFEAGLLLLPLVLSMIGILEQISSGMTDFGGRPYRSPLTFLAGPIPIHFASIADFAGLLTIVLIIFVRFLRIHRDQERASGELAAARNVQELMIPHEKLKTPGFEVDSVYNPATEVGGDFYYLDATSDGGLLVVIGDVAGKGLKAAMNVSMVMGALRRVSERGPAKILESLNRVLAGGESFTTCQAAWFGCNGELVIANAGHLPPYLNSQEIALPGGLPLGVLPEISYEEVRLYLHPGDRILLLSDGVVEARQGSGELFGFDRVHNLSNQSAFYIADAAREFGQEDDITVLTVRRLAQAVAAA